MRRISVFGATGSIGTQTLDVLGQYNDAFSVEVLSGHSNLELLAELTKRHEPRAVVVPDDAAAEAFAALLEGNAPEILVGIDGLEAAASMPVDILMSAIVGYAGLCVSMLGAEHADTLALANKESLVCAGPLLRQICAAHKTVLLPVDSEHSAIFQCLTAGKMEEVERVILTASGGPFWNQELSFMKAATPEQAAAHPNWDMGQRISIDSASLFNKAMEVIEAKELFDLSPEQIEVVVHPQSIVHSMVGYRDGSVIAQMGPPDMRGAIGYALNYPARLPLDQDRLDFAALGQLDFHPVDDERFPAISLAAKAMSLGGLSGAVFNAAKEAAQDAFLARQIGFLDMAGAVDHALDKFSREIQNQQMSLEALNDIDRRTRLFVAGLCGTE